nr:MAG TPA: hypothetical protein [Caudoviricetes sp.]
MRSLCCVQPAGLWGFMPYSPEDTGVANQRTLVSSQ